MHDRCINDGTIVEHLLATRLKSNAADSANLPEVHPGNSMKVSFPICLIALQCSTPNFSIHG